MNTPRVAVLLSGQLRLFKKTYENIYKNLIVPNNADVFIHTWFDKDNLTIDSRDANRVYESLNITDDEYLIKLYKPKKHLIEKPKAFYNENIKMPDKYANDILSMMKDDNKNDLKQVMEKCVHPTYSMFYSMYKCNELKELYALENNITYDYVVRVRFDLSITETIKLSEYAKSTGMHTPNILYREGLPCDWFLFGNNDVMNIVLSIFLHIGYLNSFTYFKSEDREKNFHYPSDICTWGNEHFIKDICRLFNLNIYYENINVSLIYS